MKHPLAASSLAAIVTGAAVVCTGCVSLATPSRSEYEATFARAIRQSLGETTANNVCLPPVFALGPIAPDSIEVTPDNDFKSISAPKGQLLQLRALESVGLLSSIESERTANGKPQKVLTFSRTEAGNAVFSNGTFCYARAELNGVTKWKGPLKLGDYQVAWVYYTTKTTHVADWARSASIVAAFPTVAAIVNGEPAKVRQVAIDLSSAGWDIAEYSRLLQLQ